MEIKVEIVANQTLKPSSPTPDHLRTVDFSIFDIFSPPIYTGGIFFYSLPTANKNNEACTENPFPNSLHVSEKLKRSLSETLTRYFPLAGTIRGASIDCNDEGAVYKEARISCPLSDFLKNPDAESMKRFVPALVDSREAGTWPLLQVQTNFFVCGGFAIGICISHKISDGHSFAMFVQGWAAAAAATDNQTVPEFTASKAFPPPPELCLASPHNEAAFSLQDSVTKRFVFNASDVAKLKMEASSVSQVQSPTRIEAVTALIWKCVTRASRSSSGKVKPSVLQQTVNLRRRIGSNLSGNCLGNLVFLFLLKAEENEMTLGDLVSKLRQEKEDFNATSREKLEGDEASSFILKTGEDIGKLRSQGGRIDLYTCTSWCNMSLYEADFGWGKPVWVAGRGTSMFKNITLLIDSRDGEGIEAWVSLSEEEMHVFELDEDLLDYASPNPSVLI